VNRQVPKNYTIIGDGKVARHIRHYFNLVGISFNQWQRSQSIKQLQQSVAQTDIILLLISDDAIEKFIQQHNFLQDMDLIHFSGSLMLDKAFGCHPLMTFGQELYDLKTYQSIPFVCDDGVEFNTIFPQLDNKSFAIAKKNKAYYHAMCVMAGNFTQILMRETASHLTSELDLPKDILFSYLLQNTKNFINNPENSATGPLDRGDFSTINKHLNTLQGDALEGIYKSFLKFSNILIQQQSYPRVCGDQESSEKQGVRLHGNEKSLFKEQSQ